MRNYRKIQKGTVLGFDWFYVVVEVVVINGEALCHCICDNANNVYSFSIDQIIKTTTPRKYLIIDPVTAIETHSWGFKLTDEDEEILKKIDREIPLDIICEVLAGVHDERWDDELE